MQPQRIGEGVYQLRTLMVNVYFVAERGNEWALVDTGLAGYADQIRRGAERLFNNPPLAILLTHGHFDHVGGLPQLARDWGTQVYAHPLEMPYLTAASPYPPPDPTVGGGAQSWLCSFHAGRSISTGWSGCSRPTAWCPVCQTGSG